MNNIKKNEDEMDNEVYECDQLGSLEKIQITKNSSKKNKKLQAKGKQVEGDSNSQPSQIFVAVKKGNLSEVDHAIKNGIDVNKSDGSGKTPLWIAALFGNEEIVEYLVNNGANISKANKNGITPVHMAIIIYKNLVKNERVKISPSVFREPTDLNIEKYKKIIVFLGNQDINYFNENKKVLKFIKKLCSEEKNDETILLEEKNNDLKKSEALTKEIMNSDVNEISHSKSSQKIQITKSSSRKNKKSQVKSKKVEGEIESQLSQLFEAVEKGNLSEVDYIIKSGVDVNKLDESGETLLHKAAKYGYEDIVKYLIDHKADINKVDKEKATPLWLAALHGHENIVKYLVNEHADINKANKYGTTPLNTAAYNEHENIVKYLVEHSADIHKVNKNGASPLWKATLIGNKKIVEYLINKGADINKANKNGITPLKMATMVYNDLVKNKKVTMHEEITTNPTDINIKKYIRN